MGPMHFTNLSTWDEHGKAMEPKWLSTGPKVCGGTTTVADGKITIEHAPRAAAAAAASAAPPAIVDWSATGEVHGSHGFREER